MAYRVMGLAVAVAAMVHVGCGGGGSSADDAGGTGRTDAADGTDGATAPDGSSDTPCETDADCDDGVFCNGEERCAPEDAEADAEGCAPAADPEPCLESQTCSEEEGRCLSDCDTNADADGDGHDAIECGGDDCDDSDPDAFPGNTEVCDDEHHDEDCDPTTFGERDADGDGHVDAMCCNIAGDGTMHCGDDCDDDNPGAHPTEAESCDGVDNDCDGMVDEGVMSTWYRDKDGDGFGDDSPDAMTMEACERPDGYRDNNDDCDDEVGSTNPAASESCDGVDNDCDDEIDEDFTCVLGETRDCTTACGRSGVETCNASCNWPGECVGNTEEVCNGCDDDGDGEIDEGVTVTCWLDEDGDTFARREADPVERCACDEGYTWRDPDSLADCDDSDPTIRPGAPEYCDGVDSNCDGFEEDADGDGHGPIRDPETGEAPPCIPTEDFPMDDCHDGNDRVHPDADWETAPYQCEGSYPCRCYDPDYGCVPKRDGFCPSGCFETTDEIFDYDCDGDREGLIEDSDGGCHCGSLECIGTYQPDTVHVPPRFPTCGEEWHEFTVCRGTDSYPCSACSQTTHTNAPYPCK